MLGAAATASGKPIPPELLDPEKKRVEITGIGQDRVLERHDPSNVIRHDGKYYVWYTEHRPGVGFIDTYVQRATSQDGYHWEVQGKALGKGKPGDWDEKGALTCYVVSWQGRFYMFYTGVGANFVDAHHSKRGIGYAVAESPDGPWAKQEDQPILWPGDNTWDDLCCDDANLIYRERKWWLYYKGRTLGDQPGQSQVGVAVSDKITGPYRKHPQNPLFPGHAFSTWVHRDGVAAIGGEAGGHFVRWSRDGVHFVKAGAFDNKSTGFHCPENFGNGTNSRGVSWGFDVARTKPRYVYRFDCTMRIS